MSHSQCPILGSYKYLQVSVVHGGLGECGNNEFPGIYVRLDDPEILHFIRQATNASQVDHTDSQTEATVPCNRLLETYQHSSKGLLTFDCTLRPIQTSCKSDVTSN